MHSAEASNYDSRSYPELCNNRNPLLLFSFFPGMPEPLAATPSTRWKSAGQNKTEINKHLSSTPNIHWTAMTRPRSTLMSRLATLPFCGFSASTPSEMATLLG